MKKPSRKKIILYSVIFIVAAAAVLVYRIVPAKASYMEETASVQNISTYYSYEGNIEAEDDQTVYATSTSTIKKIYVGEGDLVSKGDLLYELEGDNVRSNLTNAQASLSSATVNYQDAKTKLDRIATLYNAGAVSKSDYEQAKSNFDITKAQLTQAQANLNTAQNNVNDLKGYADIDGEVTDIHVEENDTIISGTEIMDVVNYDNLLVKIKVDEFDLDAVTEGETAVVSIEALNKEVGGHVSKISKKAEVLNGVSYFNAEVTLDPDAALKVGLSAEIKIQGQAAKNAVVVPIKVLQFDENNEPFVMIEGKDGKAVRTPVMTGINDGTMVEIKEGLKAGDKVLVAAQSSSSSALPFPGGERLK